MLSCFRSRCCCIPESKWYDEQNKKASKETDEYLKKCSLRAREVRSIPGILEKKSDEYQESLRLKKLSEGLTCLVTLKENPIAQCGNIGLIRSVIQDDVPFRISGCSFMLSCCGMCSRKCDVRCVQDTLHKMYFKAYPVYAGISSGDVLSKVAYQTLMDPNINYATMLEVLYSFSIHDWNEEIEKIKEETNFDSENYKYDYAPRTEVTYDSLGRGRKMCNPETGEVLFNSWPDSGMCPYCLPRVLVYPSVRSRYKRANDPDSNEVRIKKAQEFFERL